MSNIIKTLCVSVLVIAAFSPMKTTTAQTSYESRPEQPRTSVQRAWITSYSSVESCSTPKCIMASGKSAYVGAAACPRSIKLGTRIRIAGKLLTCEDRTAKRFDGRFDIFQGYGPAAQKKAFAWGIQKLDVQIL